MSLATRGSRRYGPRHPALPGLRTRSNTLVNAFVPACPNLFNLTVQNVERGTNEVDNIGYAPGFQVTLPQGTYRVFVTSALLPTPPVNDRIVVFPVVPVFKTYNVTGLDSSGTDLYNIQLTNKYPLDTVTLYEFNTSKGNVAPNATLTAAIKACAQMSVKIGATTVETFVMPFGATFPKIVGATAAAVTIDNNLNVKVNVYKDGLFIGDVGGNKTKTFASGLVAGNVIDVKRSDTGVLVKTATLVAGSQTVPVP